MTHLQETATKRPKSKCAICRTPYVKFRMGQKVCENIDCAIAQGRKDAEKRRRSAVRAECQQIKVRREALMRVRDLLPKVQAAANAYIRERDRGQPCISCGRITFADPMTGGAWDCGHYRSVGAARHLRFDARNMHLQCKRCNRDLSGNTVAYRAGLIAKIGDAEVIALESDNRIRKWTISELRSLLAWFRGERARLVKGRRSDG
jgi:hypothetical protein